MLVDSYAVAINIVRPFSSFDFWNLLGVFCGLFHVVSCGVCFIVFGVVSDVQTET